MQRLVLASILGSLAATGLCGCGGGASATPTVRYLPSRSGEGDPAATGTAEPAGTATTEVAATGFGTLTGRVVFQGGDLKLPALYPKGGAPKDPAVCGVEAIPDETIVVNDGGLANVFIYLAKAPKGEIPAAPSEPVVFDQKNCIFLPHAIVVRAGQPVKILNDDGALHNTHTYPKRNTPFNQGVQPNDRTGVELVYTRPETQPLMVGCDVHPWMKAYHLPIDHPYAAVSGPDGKFEIKDLPAGKHEFKVWHEKGGELQRALVVTIKPNEPNEVEIPVPAAKLARFDGLAPAEVQISARLLSSNGSEKTALPR